MTRDEVLVVYESGPEAVVALVQTLLESHEQQVAALSARVKELENRLGKDSHNSHKPPSSDGLAKKTSKKKKSSREKTGKKNKPGGQPGHPGTTLHLVDQPETIIEHSPKACATCGASLDEAGEEAGFERRQVHDVPPLVGLAVTEHRALRKVCPFCRSTTGGSFPERVTRPVQYGERLKALGVYLQEYQLLPFARTREMLLDLFGGAPSEGTLARAKAECHAGLEPVQKAIKRAISEEAEVVQFDETGVRIEAKTHWLHQAGTKSLTFYAHHPKRGREAFEEIGILPVFGGTSVHDCFSSYFTYSSCAHALCNAHLLRELTAIDEQGTKQQQPSSSSWAGEMIELLREIKTSVERTRAAGGGELEEAGREAFELRYKRLVAEGLRANPPPPPTGKPGRPKQSAAKNLLDRLDKHRQAVLRFMNDFSVPFDNNLAERDLRMVKVHQKVSGCFRSSEGASQFCRIRGYISTLRKQQGAHVLSALQSVFSGEPYMPRLQAE
jgi:transposase